MAYEHITADNRMTYRHRDCVMLITGDGKCEACTKLNKNLWLMKSRCEYINNSYYSYCT